MCEGHDHISDIQSIALSSRHYIDVIDLPFPPMIGNLFMDLLMDLVISITSLKNYVTALPVLGSDFPDSILLGIFQVVLKLIHEKVHLFMLGVLEEVIQIN
jgi:hypothetical protein